MKLFSSYCRVGVFLLMTSPVALATNDLVSPKEAAAMHSSKTAVIVDVREDDEWNQHHIPGAIHIPLAQLNDRLAELERYKNSPIITQCRSGGRSAKAHEALLSAGFTRVYDMEGGIQAWDEQDLLTE
ncbi:MAG: rhodanese-like domain-containing protein [Methylobacter sp.]|nr:rhodanese-like domain-containing protein [Methylobacter sp.]